MAFHFLFVFALLNIVFAGSLGAEQEEAYWKSVFPNNEMPKALKEILPSPGTMRDCTDSDSFEEFNAPIDLGENRENDGWKVQLSDSIPNEPRFYVDDWTVDSKGNHEKDGGWKVQLSDSIPNELRFYVDDWTVDSEGNKENKAESPKESKGNKDVTDVHNNGDLIKSIFFLQKDLRRGMLVNHTSLITSDRTPFLSDQIVKSIPFSSNKLPEILNHFSLKPRTKEADAMRDTIRGCEGVAMKGEEKLCATSFESLVDLSVSKLGKQIQLLSNEVSKETKDPLFSIGRGIRNMGENEIVCHKMDYPSAVFLCHSIDETIVYKVPMVGRDGTKANALAVCHKDTSAWNPNHMAFRVLKLKPGTVPICHFLIRDSLVWVSK